MLCTLSSAQKCQGPDDHAASLSHSDVSSSVLLLPTSHTARTAFVRIYTLSLPICRMLSCLFPYVNRLTVTHSQHRSQSVNAAKHRRLSAAHPVIVKRVMFSAQVYLGGDVSVNIIIY